MYKVGEGVYVDVCKLCVKVCSAREIIAFEAGSVKLPAEILKPNLFFITQAKIVPYF